MIRKNNGSILRPARGKIPRNNCGPCCGCLIWSGTWGDNTNPTIFPVPDVWFNTATCERALVWKNIQWIKGATSFWPIGTPPSNPDFILRLASHCSGVSSAKCQEMSGERKGWGTIIPKSYFPIVSPCWDFNPCTGPGDYRIWGGEWASGDEEDMFPESIRKKLDARAGLRLTVALKCRFWSKAKVKRECPNINDYGAMLQEEYGEPWFTIDYFDEYGAQSAVEWTFHVMMPNSSYAAIIDASTLDESTKEDYICGSNPGEGKCCEE